MSEQSYKEAHELANAMARHFIGKEFSAEDESCAACLEAAQSALAFAELRGTEHATWHDMTAEPTAAPRDGTRVDLLFQHKRRVTDAWFGTHEHLKPGGGWLWFSETGAICSILDQEPLGWMPAPPLEMPA